MSIALKRGSNPRKISLGQLPLGALGLQCADVGPRLDSFIRGSNKAHGLEPFGIEGAELRLKKRFGTAGQKSKGSTF